MAHQLSPPLAKHSFGPADMSVPPAKRQRLSPEPGQFASSPTSYPWATSPQAGSPPALPYLSLPNQNPTYSFHTPQPVQSPHQDAPPRFAPGVMGPPERPADKTKEQAESKTTDVNDLSDIVTASGIDLKEEENYLLATYRNRQNEMSQTASFGPATPSSISPNNSFRQWSQGSFGSQPAFQGAGPLSQPPVSQRSVEQEIDEKHRQAARRLAESKARHMQTPFLNLGNVRTKVGLATFQNQVRYSADGRHSIADPPKIYGAALKGTEGIGVIQARGTGIVNDRSLEDMLTILSLAAEQRVRDVLEDAVGLARSRRYGSQGLVPPEWASIATGNGAVENVVAKPQSLTGTAWDQLPNNAISPIASDVGLKGELPSANLDLARLPTPPSSEAPTQQTISFKAEVPPILRSLGSLERQAEQKRIAARKKRQDKERLATADTTASPATPAAPGTPGTPGAAGAAAGAAQEVKMTKKEREKQAKQLHQTEEIIRQQANNAAAMALGGKSRYSWMTSASTPAAGSGFGTGVGAGRSTPVSRTTSVVGVPQVQKEEDRGLRSRDDWKTLGDFREDGPGGKGVQLRDVVTVLERDGGIESRSLTKAYTQMRSEKQEKK